MLGGVSQSKGKEIGINNNSSKCRKGEARIVSKGKKYIKRKKCEEAENECKNVGILVWG